jgi:drug/metabolite transporter (DMT)-like permease
MSPLIFAAVLCAAAVHATWNAILKGAGDPLMSTILVAGFSAAIAALALPFLHPLAFASLPFLGVSILVQIGYYVLLANAYRLGEMSRVYPVMRGLPPTLVAAVSALALGETLPPLAWAGVGLVSIGILSLAFAPAGASGGAGKMAPGIGFALLNALVIATYTLLDGLGVRASGSPLTYTAWLFVGCGTPLLIWAAVFRRQRLIAALRRRLRLRVVAGFGNVASYGVALWAMTLAPIALVAALRETSILFGTAIAGLVLREHIDRWRVVGVCVIAAGAVTLRLA